MAIFLENVKKSGFRPGVLHQPLAPGPRGSPGSEKGGILTPWPRAGDLGLLGTPRGPSGTPGRPGSSGTPPGNRGAPARGVDVKPPSRRRPETLRDPGSRNRGSGASPSPRGGYPRGPGSRTSGTGVPGDLPGQVREPLLGLPGPWGPPGRPRRGLFYINPSRRGPAVPRGPGGVPRGYPPGRSPPGLTA